MCIAFHPSPRIPQHSQNQDTPNMCIAFLTGPLGLYIPLNQDTHNMCIAFRNACKQCYLNQIKIHLICVLISSVFYRSLLSIN